MVNHVADYPALQQVLESSEKIVYLCGAGASMALGKHKNSWVTWLYAGKERLMPAQQTAFDELTGSFSSDDLISAASYLLEHLKVTGEYIPYMDSTIGALHPAEPAMMEALRKIWRAGDLISTTNYDQLIEESVGAGYVTYENPGEMLPVINGTSKNQVIHLHGVYDKRRGVDNIIADGEQYRKILENAGAQFIQNLLSTHPIIIIGCGGTVNDPNLAGFMQFMIDKLGLTVPYFYLMKEGDTVPALPPNAVPVYFGSEYSDLPVFLDELSSYRLRNRAEIKKLILFDPYAAPKKISSAFGRMHFANRFNTFTGRQLEQDQFDSFLHAHEPILWWGVLGEGGIGKSRLALEWLRTLPFDWYGFFARKEPMQFSEFHPFTNTVVVLDYILGEEERTAQTVEILLQQFEGTPYRLRLLLIERKQDNNAEDWLSKLVSVLDPEARLLFESYRYLNGAASADEAEFLNLKPLCEEDELCYIQNYLKVFTPVFLAPTDAEKYLANLDAVSRTIQKLYCDALEEPYRRPLYLSIFTEVWINKDGAINIKGTKQLLNSYLKKEIDRWKLLLGETKLVNSYLKLLAIACVTEQFNITDTLGKNYLQEDCNIVSAFLDEADSYPGKQSIFNDLFVEQDELEEFDPEESSTLDLFDEMSQMEQLSQDEKIAFLAPYIKLEADPEEFYLQMLNGAGGLTEEDSARLKELREERIRKVESLPDYAWIIAPAFPDIIREYVLLYVLKDKDITRFTKLARANSIFGISGFLAHAMEDWPGEKLFQKMLVTPPDNVLEYFEFYFPLLTAARRIDDFSPIEMLLNEGKATALFAKYEMELWNRIAIVLTERENWSGLLDSADNFLQYVSEGYDHPRIKERAVEVLESYCIGFFNGMEADRLEAFLVKCDAFAGTFPEDPQLASFCCNSWGRLVNLRCYLGQTDLIEQDWRRIAEYLTAYPQDRTICLSAITAADDYFTYMRMQQEDIYQRTQELARLLGEAMEHHPIIEVAELLANVTANLYMFELDRTSKHSEELFSQIRNCFNTFSKSKRVRLAYASVCGMKYMRDLNYTYDVPSKVMQRLKKWSTQYLDEIEFQEAYFNVLFVHFMYAHAHNLRGEMIRAFQELDSIAKRTDYGKYHEDNKLQERVEQLRLLVNC